MVTSWMHHWTKGASDCDGSAVLCDFTPWVLYLQAIVHVGTAERGWEKKKRLSLSESDGRMGEEGVV